MDTGDKIRTLRLTRGLSLSQLSQRAGISKGYLSQIESGRSKTPSGMVLATVASALKVSVGELVEDMMPLDVLLGSAPAGLAEFAGRRSLGVDDVRMLSHIPLGSEQSPASSDDWEEMYNSIMSRVQKANH